MTFFSLLLYPICPLRAKARGQNPAVPPARGGGEPISQERLEEMLRRLEPAVFFDRGLCAHYFTYMKGPQAHFVLFDSPRSIREKLDRAKALGLAAALLPQPEVEDHLEEIFGAEA